MNPRIVNLDVRDDIRNGREPFSKIMGAVAQLRPDESLLLLAPFEPKPLFDVMAGRGFGHAARRNASGDWEVLFTRERDENAAPRIKPDSAACGCSATRPVSVVEIDARGLEPPQPLLVILEVLAALPENAELRARTDRRPLHLYAQLEERGFVGETKEEENGSFITCIRR